MYIIYLYTCTCEWHPITFNFLSQNDLSIFQTFTLLNFEPDPGFGEGLGLVSLVTGGDLIPACPRELSEPNIDFLPTSMESNIAFICDTPGASCTFSKESVFSRDELACTGFLGSFFPGLGGDLDGFTFLPLESG